MATCVSTLVAQHESHNHQPAASQTAPETHLKNLRQLTFGGDNAEAYWSFDSKAITFQSNFKTWGVQCDQIFTSPIKKMGIKDTTRKSTLVSTGLGRTTCSYFMPDNKHILYASTHEGDAECPPTPESNGKYVWAIYSNFDIYVADF